MKCGEDVDISPLAHLGGWGVGGKWWESNFLGELCRESASASWMCLWEWGQGEVLGPKGKKKSSMKASDTGTCWVKFHFFIVSAPA